jgi:hypothetical protein
MMLHSIKSHSISITGCFQIAQFNGIEVFDCKV